jgi:hypothetical protein
MQLFQKSKTPLFLFLFIFSINVKAELIFKDGFDLTESEINCPLALPMTETTSGLGGVLYRNEDVINPAGNKDYFSFPVLDDQWFYIATSANPNNDSELIDTVISVYSSNGTDLLAQNDDAVIGSSPDSTLYYHAINTENLCIKVEDVSTFSGSTPEGGSTFIYAIVALPIDFDLYDDFNIDTEPNDTTNTAQTNLSTFQYSGFQESTSILGEFNNSSDIDNYQLLTPFETLGLQIIAKPSGNTGYGGTSDIGSLEIISADGTEILAQINPSLGVSEIFIPAQAGTNYIVQSNSPTLPIGDNPFYSLFWKTIDGLNPQESNDTANNLFTGAEVANPISQPFATSHFIGGTLSGVSDTDWWSFEANTGDTINLYCSSWYIGSGVRNATFNIFESPILPPLQTEVEVENQQLNWSNQINATTPEIPVSTSTTHYLSIDANLFSNTVTGRYYQCGIHVIHP